MLGLTIFIGEAMEAGAVVVLSLHLLFPGRYAHPVWLRRILHWYTVNEGSPMDFDVSVEQDSFTVHQSVCELPRIIETVRECHDSIKRVAERYSSSKPGNYVPIDIID